MDAELTCRSYDRDYNDICQIVDIHSLIFIFICNVKAYCTNTT